MAATSTMSYVDQMREMAKSARKVEKQEDNVEDWKEKKKEADILKFFESEIVMDAKNKITERATKGCYSANILEYDFGAYFYINKKGNVVIENEFKKITGYYLHRIHFAVKSQFFQDKLHSFVKEFGEQMQYDCWYPGRDKINVITLFWGPTKTHKWELVWVLPETLSEEESEEDEEKYEEDEPEEQKKSEELKIAIPDAKETYASKVSPRKKK